MERSYGFKARYFLIYRRNQVIALCPFYQRIKDVFTGLMCLPPPALNPYITTVTQVLRKCADIARIHNLSFVTFGLRGDQSPCALRLGANLHSTGSNRILNLDQNPPDKIWRPFSRKIRMIERDGSRLDDVKVS